MKEQELIIKLKTFIKALPQDKAGEFERFARALWNEAEQAKQERREAEQTLSVSASKVKQAEQRAEQAKSQAEKDTQELPKLRQLLQAANEAIERLQARLNASHTEITSLEATAQRLKEELQTERKPFVDFRKLNLEQVRSIFHKKTQKWLLPKLRNNLRQTLLAIAANSCDAEFIQLAKSPDADDLESLLHIGFSELFAIKYFLAKGRTEIIEQERSVSMILGDGTIHKAPDLWRGKPFASQSA